MLPKVFCFFKGNQQNNKTVALAPSNTGGTVTIAANIKASTASKPRSNSSSVATGSLNVKHDPDEGYCDLTMEPPPIKRCQTSSRCSLA